MWKLQTTTVCLIYMIEISENNVWLFSITHNSQKKTENAAVMETFNVYAQHSFN